MRIEVGNGGAVDALGYVDVGVVHSTNVDLAGCIIVILR